MRSGKGAAISLFWSDDGEWIGFAEPGIGLRKVSIRGGFPVTIVETVDFMGADWGRDDAIVFSDNRGLTRVHSDGEKGDLILSSLDRYAWPQNLPDGGLLVTVSGT